MSFPPAARAAFLAIETRDALFGWRARLGAQRRTMWARVCWAHIRSGRLGPRDVQRVALAYAAELRPDGKRLEYADDVDDALRREMARRLGAEARRQARPWRTAEERREGRIRGLARS
ncbi:MAG: hypothetical protein NUW22_09020 [Acidobacteria bacterium]|nr:hypothetical protein [Acidobacteriota bacterium]